jgi:hypothetical protein
MLRAETAILCTFWLGPVDDIPEWIEMTGDFFDILIFDLVLFHQVAENVKKIVGKEAEAPLFDPGGIGIKGRLS